MTRFISIPALALLLFLLLTPAVSLAGGNNAFVAVYNTGRAQVREMRTVTLPKGPAAVVFTDVPATLDPTSIRAAAPGMAVKSIQYAYRPVTPKNLLDMYVGKELSVILPDPADANGRILRKATLISNADRPVFAMGKEVYIGSYEALVLPELPKGFDEKPTLTLTTDNDAEGRRNVALHYLMGGLGWRADYTMMVKPDGLSADLEAWATVTNSSDYGFQGADLRLVAGDVQRTQANFKMARMAQPMLTMEAAADSAGGAVEESFSEYHVYTLDRAVNLPPQGARQLSLFSAASVPVEQELVSRYRAGTGQRAGKISQGVESLLTFRNLAENHLGRPLPAGQVRVFMPTMDGHQLLAGETRLDHVADGGEVRLVLGRSFDVNVERRQTAYKKIGKNAYEIGWAVTVTNGKKVPQDLILKETFPGQWEVLSADAPYAKTDSATIEFDLKGLPPSAGTAARSSTTRFGFNTEEEGHAGDRTQGIETLKDFYALMGETRQVRYRAVGEILAGRSGVEAVASLDNALATLESVPEDKGRKVLLLSGERTISLDMEYEIEELRKDLFYIEKGEDAFLNLLADLHPGFREHVAAGRDLLAGLDINGFITDRDGTINNYCARYLTSIQSVYNAVFLSRFALSKVTTPVILTSAPLEGLIEISVNPEGKIYYAASKGRECLDLEGRIRRLPIPPEKQAAIDTLNERLTALTSRPEYEKFTLIGSGLQFKFGQTTVARQDIGRSVDEAESDAFMDTLRRLVAELDPAALNFRIEDTGLDVEIILTVETEGEGLKDFDKGDGVKYLNAELDFQMFRGPHLICGDTGSDVPMLEAALDLAPDTRAIYVTRNRDLAKRVMGLTTEAVIVPEPDMLVTILGTL